MLPSKAALPSSSVGPGGRREQLPCEITDMSDTQFRRCLIAILILQLAYGKLFYSTMYWQRIGATPQFLSSKSPQDTTNGTLCGSQFNTDPTQGCSAQNARLILFTVEAVFDATIFLTTPKIGTEIMTNPPCYFCSGQPGDSCYQAYLEVINISKNVSQRSNVTLVYTQFQKLTVYSNKVISTAVATFRTVPTYPQCTGKLQNTICFAPQNGDTVDPITGNSFCSTCLNDIANQTVRRVPCRRSLCFSLPRPRGVAWRAEAEARPPRFGGVYGAAFSPRRAAPRRPVQFIFGAAATSDGP